MSDRVEMRLTELGVTIPEVQMPRAQYVLAKRVGDLLFISGQGPRLNGVLEHAGRIGRDLSVDEGYEAARRCALNVLAVIQFVEGSLDNVREVVHVRGFVNSADGFHDQPKVVDGASDLFVSVWGDAGRHARVALGTSALPNNIAVELECVVRMRQGIQE